MAASKSTESMHVFFTQILLKLFLIYHCPITYYDLIQLFHLHSIWSYDFYRSQFDILTIKTQILETHPEPCQTTTTKHFAKIANGISSLTIFATKCSILDV